MDDMLVNAKNDDSSHEVRSWLETVRLQRTLSMHFAWLLSITFLLNTALQVVAQQPASDLDLIKPYLEKATTAVLQVDLVTLDSPDIVDWTGQKTGNLAVANNQMVQMLRNYITLLRQVDVSNLYGSLALDDRSKVSFVIYLPCKDTKKAKERAELMLKPLAVPAKFQAHEVDNMVIVADESTWARIASKPNAADTRLLKALPSKQPIPLQLIVCVPDGQQQQSTQFWTSVFPEWPLKGLLSEFPRVKVTANFLPEFSIVTYLDSNDNASAQRGLKVLEQYLAANPTVKMDTKLQGKLLKVSISVQQMASAAGAAKSAIVTQNNLREILLAMHEYHQAHRMLPQRDSRSSDGKPLLSWRVHLLPYFGQRELYQQFHLDEPWDSAHNSTLITKMPEIYSVGDQDTKAGKTQFVLPIISGGLWESDEEGMTFDQIKDGLATTIMVLQAPSENSVVWTQPQDLDLNTENLVGKVFGNKASTNVGFCEGSIREIKQSIDPKTLKAFFTIQGGENVTQPKR